MRNLWALPGTVLGLILAVVYWPTGWEYSNGVLWLRCKRILPSSAAAQTWGHVVWHTRQLTPRLRIHEKAHVTQWRSWGPLFLLAYPLASFAAWWRGEHYYRDNCFETEARRFERG